MSKSRSSLASEVTMLCILNLPGRRWAIDAKSVAVLCCGVATSEDLQELEAERASNCVRLKVIKWWKCLRDGIERRSIINIMILLRDIQGQLFSRNES